MLYISAQCAFLSVRSRLLLIAIFFFAATELNKSQERSDGLGPQTLAIDSGLISALYISYSLFQISANGKGPCNLL